MGTCSIDCSSLQGTHRRWYYAVDARSADSLPTGIQSPVFSELGAQIGLLKLTVTLSVVDMEIMAQQAMGANAEMASAPIDPTVRPPSGLSDVADTAKGLDFGSVLARLDGFMKVAELAAEVCRRHFKDRTIQSKLYMQVHPLVKLAWGVVSVACKVKTPNKKFRCFIIKMRRIPFHTTERDVVEHGVPNLTKELIFLDLDFLVLGHETTALND